MAVTGYNVLLLQAMTSRWCTCGCYRLQCVTVTDDDQQVVYVWLDALVSYLTASGYPDQQERWPPDCQVLGKDILK